MSVIDARPAGHREQRFGSPGNIGLFALVRCAMPAGSLGLVVPIADVPLITWFFGGQPDVPESALPGSAVTPGPARKLMSKKLAWTLIAAGCGLMAGPPVVAANAAGLSGSWILRVPYGIGWLLFIEGSMNILRAHRQKRRVGAAGAWVNKDRGQDVDRSV
jgi:hypothetical protein